jgi:hypothetical protein
MSNRPDDDGSMFFLGMRFAPTESMKQSDLNRIVIELFSRYFLLNGEKIPIKHTDNPMLSLVQFLLDIDFMLTEEAFSDIPDDLKKLFIVKHRDGTEYRYGQKPRW